MLDTARSFFCILQNKSPLNIAFDPDHAIACSFSNNRYKLHKAMPERNLCLYKIVQFEKFSLYEELYNDLNATHAVSTDTRMT